MTGVVSEDKQDPPKEKDPIKVSFSLPQITGGALAAATAATIGSQLGVAGTILGAMVASIVGGIAGTLYSAGIDRTHRKVSQAIVRGYDRLRHDASYDPAEVRRLDAESTTQPLPGVAAAALSEEVQSQLLPALDDSVFRADTTPAHPAPANGGEPARRRKSVWTVMALTVGAMFLVALAVITVVELGLGHPLGGGSGTTVGEVVRPRSSAKPTPTATVTITPTPTETATTEPTATGTPTATIEPTATDTPTAATTGTSAPADNAQPSEPAQSVG